MQAHRIWLGLGFAAAALVAVASAGGVFVSDYVYARETVSWMAQGIGQDWANLLLVVPGLLITSWLAARGSVRALAVWRGCLLGVAAGEAFGRTRRIGALTGSAAGFCRPCRPS